MRIGWLTGVESHCHNVYIQGGGGGGVFVGFTFVLLSYKDEDKNHRKDKLYKHVLYILHLQMQTIIF